MQCPFDDPVFVGNGAVLTSPSGGSPLDYPRISIKGGTFSVMGSDTEVDPNELRVVIVGANPKLSKTWYKEPWSEDGRTNAPDCFSLDGMAPDPSAKDPQNDICATCIHNAWGSRITDTGQQVKACSDQKRLAVVMLDKPDGEIYLLQVTPSALKGLNKYHKELSSRGIPAEIVLTRVYFDTESTYPKLAFAFGGFLDSDTQAVVDKLFGSDIVKHITGESPKNEGEIEDE